MQMEPEKIQVQVLLHTIYPQPMLFLQMPRVILFDASLRFASEPAKASVHRVIHTKQKRFWPPTIYHDEAYLDFAAQPFSFFFDDHGPEKLRLYFAANALFSLLKNSRSSKAFFTKKLESHLS